MFCSKCGAENREGAMFCDKCGNKIKNESQKNMTSLDPTKIIEQPQISQTTLQEPTNIQSTSTNNIIETNKQTNSKNSIIIVIIVIASIFIVMLICLCLTLLNQNSVSKSTPNNTEITNENEQKLQPSEEESKSESQVLQNKISELYKENLAFSPGNYVQGDIPAGEYAFVKQSSRSSYYCEDDAAGEIIDNENFDSFGYVKVHAAGNLETNGILINVDAFEKLGVSGAKDIYQKLNDKTEWNQAGYYKVGVDIEPGNYIVESMGRGYYAILTGPVGSNDIIDNDNFNGKATISISEGQYLTISRSSITKQ